MGREAEEEEEEEDGGGMKGVEDEGGLLAARPPGQAETEVGVRRPAPPALCEARPASD